MNNRELIDKYLSEYDQKKMTDFYFAHRGKTQLIPSGIKKIKKDIVVMFDDPEFMNKETKLSRVQLMNNTFVSFINSYAKLIVMTYPITDEFVAEVMNND